MFETLESRELFSVTLTPTDAPAPEPAPEPSTVVVERDASAGQAAGKRHHASVEFVKEWS